MAAMVGEAAGQLPFQSSQWVPSQPQSTQAVLTEITFDQYSPGAYSSAVSESFYNSAANPNGPAPTNYSSIGGPGLVGIGAASGFGSGPSALFTGFADNGSPDVLTLYSTIVTTSFARYLDGLSFDVYSGELPGGLHGPTSFYVQISRDDAFSVYWQSELVQLTPGTANAIHWDITNPDGNDSNGDGFFVMSPLPSSSPDTDWRSISFEPWYSSAHVDVRIIASGANSTLTGLGLDNIQITGVVVPEPSSCLLLALGLFVIGGRSRPRRA